MSLDMYALLSFYALGFIVIVCRLIYIAIVYKVLKYRIRLHPKYGYFVEIRKYFIWWEATDSRDEILYFSNLEQAEFYVSELASNKPKEIETIKEGEI